MPPSHLQNEYDDQAFTSKIFQNYCIDHSSISRVPIFLNQTNPGNFQVLSTGFLE